MLEDRLAEAADAVNEATGERVISETYLCLLRIGRKAFPAHLLTVEAV
jgi:hypothetical protein